MLPRKTFIYFLLETPTGKAYYRDSSGTVKTQVITAGATDVTLKNSPANWIDTELGYDRNSTYNGMQRSFSTPMDFVRDVLQMIKELFLLGLGTEEPLTLAVFKYNSQPKAGEPDYKLYFKSNIDLSTISETVLETLTTSLMEGGVLQLLKSFEGTTLQIPCDGSIKENQKVHFDGALVQDKFYYNIIPINNVYPTIPYNDGAFSPLAASFINNDGDNYGIVHSDASSIFVLSGSFDYTAIGTDAETNGNYIFFSSSQITVQLAGQLIIRFNKRGVLFQLMAVTSLGLPAFPITGKITAYNTTEINVSFNQSITLGANEKLFIYFQVLYTPYGGETGHNVMDFLGGSFTLGFESKAQDTRAWAISFPDLFKLIVKEVNLLSSTDTQIFNYGALSNLLNDYSNLFALSGDSLRASGDPSYQRFYSLTQTNQILQSSFGPVIKINLKDFFQSVEAILCAEMQSDNTNLRIETIDSIYDSSKVDFDLGEVAKLKWSFAQDKGFSDFEIGYQPQSYDQKAGKYEWNTTLAMKAPIKSFQKKVSKISKIRFDSYGIEKLRSNTGEATSTTRNDSDNSVFGVNVDLSNWIYDYFNANFTSLNNDPDDANNTNIKYYQNYNIHQQNIPCQPLNMPITDGDYFQPNNDQAIIIFTVGASQNGRLILTGLLNSVNKPTLAPADTFTLRIWHNGRVIYTNVTTVNSVNTPIGGISGIDYSFTETFLFKDSFYITMETSATCQADSIAATVTFAETMTPSIFWGNLSASNVPVDTGTSQKLLSYSVIIPTVNPYIIGTSFIQYGFQYFTFVSSAFNTGFSLIAGFQGYVSGDTGTFEIDVYINGFLQDSNIIINSEVSRTTFAHSLSLAVRNYKLNDMIFFTASVGAPNMNASIFAANLLMNSDYIKAYSLKRVQYDYLSGIPNLAKNAAGEYRTDIAGAPYNIEDVTPKSMYNRWKNYIKSCFMDKVTGQMIFQTLSKNEYLQRSLDGNIIVENSNENILDANRLFYPIDLEITTNVPIGFAELMAASQNAHIHFTFMGNDIYFFADSLKQKPALNESQVWKGTLSPKTDLQIFAKINSFKIPDMSDNSISCAFASSLQFVPYNQTLPAKYHTYNRDSFLFVQQTGLWDNKNNYLQPVQIGDTLPLQFITRGLSPVSYTVYNCDGNVYLGPINLDSPTSPAINDPYILWQKIIDTTSWDAGNYYIMITAGVGSVAATLISEPLAVRTADQMAYTVLIEYKNSFNSQGIVFDAGFVGSMRVPGGYDNMFKQKYIGKAFIDQPQDIVMLNGIAYEITSFFLFPVPDYVAKKVLRALIMDGTTLDGEGFSLNEGAEFEETFTEGSPVKMQKVDIRPSKNLDGINVVASGVDTDGSLIVSVAQAFGPNVTNSSGTTDTDLIQITVGN